MKSKFRIVSFVLVIILLSFLITKNITNNPSTKVDASSSTYTVTLINGNEEGGNITIGVDTGSKDSDGKTIYEDKKTTKITVDEGTKIKMYYSSLNEGYKVYGWASSQDSLLNMVQVNDAETDNKVLYTKDYLVQTIKSDLTIYTYSMQEGDHIVSFYNSSVESKRSLIGIKIVHDGDSLTSKSIKAPKQSGFNFNKWSKSLKDIHDNIDVYPIYNTGIAPVFRDYYPMFFKGLAITLLLSVVSVFLALFLGIGVCFCRLSSIKVIDFIATAYVEIIRGVPLLLQLLLIYVVLGPTKIHIGSFFSTEVISCILALFINSGAYSSEIFRSGIQAVDKGQMEAGRALGMSKWKVMFKIVMPQGIKNSLPAIGNELIMMIKETSLAVSVDASIGELMSVRKNITAATFINLPPYIIVAIIYFIVTFSLSKIVRYVEKRLSVRD